MPESAREVAWQEPVQVARGEARRGEWRGNESEFRWVDDPTVALFRDGRAAVAWVDQARKDIFFQTYGPGGQPALETPTNLSRSSDTFSWLPRVVVAPDDPTAVNVLWQEIVFSGGSHGGEIFFARSDDGGRSFSRPINLSNTTAGAGKGRLDERTWDNGSLDLARAPHGTLVAAWTEYEGALLVSRSEDGGRSFSAPLRIGDAGEAARGPSLAVGPDGTVHLAWAAGERRADNLRHAVSRDGGRSFGRGRTVAAGEGFTDAPRIAVDREGTVHLVHAASPEGRDGRRRVRYARLPRGAEEFGASVALDERDDAEQAHYPEVAVDTRGRVHVIWERYPDADRRPRGIGFTLSRDGGDTFTEPTTVPGVAPRGFNGGLQGLLMNKLAVDDAGGIAVVNSTFEPNRGSAVWLVRGRDAGAP